MNLYKHYLSIIIILCLFCACEKEHYNIDKSYSIPKDLKILWIGTSIPEGCTYPINSCKKIGLDCTNNSIGASFLAIYNIQDKGVRYAGLSLTETIEEKEAKYRDFVKKGIITEDILESFKNASFEHTIMPLIKSTDIVIIDHGYNDNISLYKLYENRSTIPEDDTIWTSTNRSSFIGAFNYLYKKIKKEKPQIKFIIGGYFQNSCTFGYSIRGKYVSKVLCDLSHHYSIPCLDIWNYTHIPDGYMPHSENYIDSINGKYQTCYQKWMPNEKGEITYFQKYCPDTVHPFSDPTGTSNIELDSIFSFILPQKIQELYNKNDFSQSIKYRK